MTPGDYEGILALDLGMGMFPGVMPPVEAVDPFAGPVGEGGEAWAAQAEIIRRLSPAPASPQVDKKEKDATVAKPTGRLSSLVSVTKQKDKALKAATKEAHRSRGCPSCGRNDRILEAPGLEIGPVRATCGRCGHVFEVAYKRHMECMPPTGFVHTGQIPSGPTYRLNAHHGVGEKTLDQILHTPLHRLGVPLYQR